MISDEVSQNIGVVVAACQTMGFEGVEIRSLGGTAPEHLADAELEDAAATLREAGLEVAGFCPAAMKDRLPISRRQFVAARALVERSARQAHLLGLRAMRVFSFYREGPPDPRRAARAAADVLEGCDLAGVRLLLETGTRTNTPSVGHALTFLEAVGRHDMGILWDPGNTAFSGIASSPCLDDYRQGRHLIEHVHVKDPRGASGYVRLGDGDLPWEGILRTLVEDGYGGWVSLETHWRPGQPLSVDLRDRPWGHAFSAGGFEASVECMQRLRVLRQMVTAS